MKLNRRLASLRPCLPKMAADSLVFAAAYALAFKLRLETIDTDYMATLALTLPLVVAMKIAVYHYVGSYRSIWRYASLTDLEDLGRGTLLSAVGVAVCGFLLPEGMSLPRSVPFIDMTLALCLAGATRMTVRLAHETTRVGNGNGKVKVRGKLSIPRVLLTGRPHGGTRRVLIVGAGDAGEMIVREMLRNPRMDYAPIAFVDDDPAKHGQSIHGIAVLGERSAIPDLVSQHTIAEIIIAIPSARGQTVRDIVQVCRSTPAVLKILPDLSRLTDGKVQVSDLREVEIEDLLGREPAALDIELISSYLRGKRILVTGAGGSIGAELCRQILRYGPAELQLLGRGENSIYEIHREVAKEHPDVRVVQVIGDVINKKKLEGTFAACRPQIVFHAGADKHVPLMETNPDEAVLNNIVGTRNVLDVSNAFGVERVVCISSDKAVNPTSVMGCCKRVAELLVRGNLYTNTIAVAVRFGNVLGSRGSVIPHFQRQIADGGPITVTDRKIKRYFMTIPEAAGLVIQAGAMGRGGEIFVLDMGEPVKIWDLAASMCRLAGLEPGRDIEIKETGLRPGEKMFEELMFRSEIPESTTHPKITCVRGNGVDPMLLLAEINHLAERAVSMDAAGIRAGLARVVPEYSPAEGVQDLTTPTGGGR